MVAVEEEDLESPAVAAVVDLQQLPVAVVVEDHPQLPAAVAEVALPLFGVVGLLFLVALLRPTAELAHHFAR